MKLTLSPRLCGSLIWSALTVFRPAVAFAADAKSELVAGKEPATTDIQPFVSDGSPFVLESIGVRITPPKGWEVDARKGGRTSLVMSEPKPDIKHVTKETITYQRNITLSVKHEATPIDEKTADSLSESLKKDFGKIAMVQNYNVLETKVFEYRPKSKGLMVYANFQLNDVNMMQLLVLVSGGEKQYLQVYTDLASRFSNKDEGFTQAWNAMTSIEVQGEAPVRYQLLSRYGTLAILTIVALLASSAIRARRRKKKFAESVMAMESGEHDGDAVSAVVSNAWGDLDGEAEGVTSPARPLDSDADQEPAVSQIWHLSDVAAPAKAPHVRIKTEELAEENPEVAIDRAGDDWVLPVRTRISPARISSGC